MAGGEPIGLPDIGADVPPTELDVPADALPLAPAVPEAPCAIAAALMPTVIAINTDLTNIRLSIMNSLLSCANARDSMMAAARRQRQRLIAHCIIRLVCQTVRWPTNALRHPHHESINRPSVAYRTYVRRFNSYYLDSSPSAPCGPCALDLFEGAFFGVGYRSILGR